MNIKEKIHDVGIVPVVVIEDVKDAVPLANALLAGGICFMEITLRTACALDAIKEVATNVHGMIVGAGTVLNRSQAADAVAAGAEFIVSPGLDEETVIYCKENNIYCCPGCVTPTEIMKAISLGLDVVKFFPANVYGGLKALKALAAPFTGVKFLPTGGINEENMSEFAEAPFIIAIGGSFVCTKKDIKDNNFDKITELSKITVEKIKKARS